MNCIIIYWSRYGHGKQIVENLVDRLEKNEIETSIHKPDDVDPKNIPEADLYVFSSPTEAFRIKSDMRKFMKKIEKLDGKKYGIINTHSMKRNWLKSMDKILKKKGMKKLAEVDFQIGKEGAEKGEALPEGWERKLDNFARNLTKKAS